LLFGSAELAFPDVLPVIAQTLKLQLKALTVALFRRRKVARVESVSLFTT